MDLVLLGCWLCSLTNLRASGADFHFHLSGCTADWFSPVSGLQAFESPVAFLFATFYESNCFYCSLILYFNCKENDRAIRAPFSK